MCQPSKHIKVGHYKPNSETQLKWCFAGRLIVFLDVMLAENLDKSGFQMEITKVILTIQCYKSMFILTHEYEYRKKNKTK